MTLKDYFKQRLGTQKDMAKQIGTTQGYVSRLARGIEQVPPRLVRPIARATGNRCTPAELRPDLYGPEESGGQEVHPANC